MSRYGGSGGNAISPLHFHQRRSEVRIYLILALVTVVGLGCGQMRYAGRYQEVTIDSEPQGAMVLIEGGIAPRSPVAVKGEGGMELVYSSPMQLTTPAVVILDKDGGQYHLKVSCEGYPEYEKTLATRFAFHPFLIITFPVVPFWSDYEIQRFDDVFVDFAAYKAELEAAKYGEAEKLIKAADEEYIAACADAGEVRDALKAKEQELEELQGSIGEMEGKVKEAQEALEAAGEEKPEEAQAELDEASAELESALETRTGLESEIEELRQKLSEVEGRQLEAKKKLDDAKQQLSNLKGQEEEKKEN
jgi:hypothetical protein